ncbi:Uncharacterised protein [Burkholderia pseudomallei]|nr:Uncharacterised protein [Burkholderia pseudomallei]CAJ6539639.1 Uncharacterised protein [Burkholderia pseudomallei]CAJ8523999.1 Uncharacterised protein [Burkholderia pseudomallei]CAJ8621152.1 Uncharacterised protein [Burkholderia pseudomallei]CAJ8789216.1 Uncharacterised protein [Burkholderia pseudomallei]
MPARPRRLLADHREARAVVRIVLDQRIGDLQPVVRRRAVARDRGDRRVVGREPRGFRVARDRLPLEMRRVRREPLLALRERLRMRAHALHAVELACLREQIVMNRQRQLAADQKLRMQQQIERARHRAFRRILDRHDAERRGARLDRAEHLVDRRARQPLDRLAEVVEHRLFAIGADGPEERDVYRLLEIAARRHDLAPDRADVLARERPGAHVLQARDHLLLALRPEHGRVEVLLDLADLERDRRALIQQRDQLRVDRVDALAQRLQAGIEFVVHDLTNNA